MKKILGAAIGVLIGLSAVIAFAQKQIVVDINKANIQWTWAQGAGGVATQFNVKCGPATGNYTKVTPVTDVTVRTLPVATAVTGDGTWFCVVSASNGPLESPNSPEVTFFAGTAPLAPTTTVIVVQ